MATAAERIMANLPPTFAPLPRPTAISAIADAFGGELSQAENALAAVMFSHWVDYADSNVDEATDLPLIAALYGLAPRDDESIEEFRAHLKRYIRTFIEGTVTVRGICRIVAEALGLVIADEYAQIDTWWSRGQQPLTTTDAARDDAAVLLFGTPAVAVRGVAARAASFAGTVDLTRPIDLRGRSLLQIAVDGRAATTFDLAAQLSDPAAADIGAIVASLASFPGLVAASQNGRLVLRSATSGEASRLELGDLAGDAAPAILGIAPHEFAGAAAKPAQIAGLIDLPATLDLTRQRYLRLTVDGTASYEIDCAAGNAAATTPAQVLAAIAVEAGAGIASLDGSRLVLASPTPGLAGTVALSVPTAGDATRLLLGNVATYARGSDAAPARVSGSVDLSAGVDLSERSSLALAIDAMTPVTVNCAGADPAKTLAGEIANAINAAIGSKVATQNGQTVTLTSTIVGPGGRIRLLRASSGDALDLIFGLASRTATGADAQSASFTGQRDPVIPLDLRARQRLQIAIDDGAPVIVDFAAAGLARAGVQPAQIANAINARTGNAVATAAGANLTLASSEPGEQGSVAIVPIETSRARHFVSRAFPLDEASHAVLGRFMAEARGAGATVGSLTGTVDLHDGVDLRTRRFLRLSVDGGPQRDIDCASCSVRPYAALVADILNAINQGVGGNVATMDNGRLVLTSPTAGAASAVVAGANAGDVSRIIFGFDPKIVTGADARRLVFTGLVDLSKHIDLGAADRVKLAIDGRAAVEIACAGVNPAATSAAEIAIRINAALGGSYASTDGTYLRLSSALAGDAGAIEFLAPSQHDATRAIFGLSAGRSYHGDGPTAATLIGAHDLAAALDLTAAAFVRLAVDDREPVLIDCRGQNPAATTPAEIAARIGAMLAPSASATLRGARIVVVAASTGAASRIALRPAGDSDARALLLGDAVPRPGRAAAPATLTGNVDLGQPVDLSRRSILRLAIDGGRPVEIDLSGAAPDRTFGDEIVAAIDRQLPGVASLDDEGHLILASPNAGADSSIAVQPLRPIEVIEYPAVVAPAKPRKVGNGATFTLDNDGAAEATVAFTLSGTSGVCGIDLIGLSTGQRIHIDAVAHDNQSISIAAGPDGRIDAAILDADGVRVPIAPERISATPSALAVEVPFNGPRPLASGERGARPALILLDPLAANSVIIEQSGAPARITGVSVVPANPAASSAPPDQPSGGLTLIGRLRATGRSGELQDAAGVPIARVRAANPLTPFDNQMVVAIGTWYPAGAASLLAIATIARIFDVTVDGVTLPAVTIDARAGTRSLSACLSAPGGPGVIARDVVPSEALRLPRGRSNWMVVQCGSARFDAACYDASRFAGGPCAVPGVFNVSRFNAKRDDAEPEAALSGELTRFNPFAADQFLSVSATWQSHRPGAFVVNLPADLPDTFGARFNGARFASQGEAAENYPGIVLDPQSDDSYIGTVLAKTNGISLIRAQWVASVPLGWEPQTVPFAQPRRRFLTGGRADRPASLYLQQPGVAGAFGLFAREPGAWGNQVSVTVRFAAPAIFDLTVSHAAARFECARTIAFAGRVLKPGEDAQPALTAAAIKPGPVGAVQAKAAGIHATVTRERAEASSQEGPQSWLTT